MIRPVWLILFWLEPFHLLLKKIWPSWIGEMCLHEMCLHDLHDQLAIVVYQCGLVRKTCSRGSWLKTVTATWKSFIHPLLPERDHIHGDWGPDVWLHSKLHLILLLLKVWPGLGSDGGTIIPRIIRAVVSWKAVGEQGNSLIAGCGVRFHAYTYCLYLFLSLAWKQGCLTVDHSFSQGPT